LSYKDKNLIKTVSVELDHIRGFEEKLTKTYKTVTAKDLPIVKLKQSSTSINVVKMDINTPTFTSHLNKGYNSYLPNNIIIEESPSMSLDKSKLDENYSINDKTKILTTVNGDSFIDPVNNTLPKSNYRCETEVISTDVSPIEVRSNKRYFTSKVALKSSDNKFFKRYFIFQLRKTFLAIKKHTFNKKIIKYKTLEDTHALKNLNNIPGYNKKEKLIYQDIFTNYSQINTNSVINFYQEGENNTLRINNYRIFRNEIIGRGSFSKIYKANNCADGKEYVRIN
jgi:hypothetical protein